MLRYNPPDINDLREFFSHVSGTYEKEAGDKRKIQISQLDGFPKKIAELKLDDPDARDAMIAELVRVIEEIKPEYENAWIPLDYKPTHHRFIGKTGSDLAGGIEHALEIDIRKPATVPEKFLSDRERYIYLRKLEKRMIAALPKDEKERKEQQAYIDSIHAAAKRVLVRSQPMIDMLLRRPPTEPKLLRSFRELPDVYDSRCAKETGLVTYFWGRDSSRSVSMQFIRLAHQKREAKTETKSMDRKDEQKKETTPSLDYPAAFGFLLWNMIQIEKNWGSGNSILYQECRRILNITHSNDVDINFRIECLSAMQKWAAHMVANPDETAKWQTPQFDAANFFLTLRNSLISQNDALVKYSQQTLPAPINAIAESIAASAAQFGVTITFLAAFNRLVFQRLTIGKLVSLIAPESALILGLIFMLNNAVRSLVVGTIASPIVPLTDRVVKKPIELTVGAVTIAAETTANLLLFQNRLKELAAEPEDIADWIEALLDSPEDLFSKEQKEKLLRVVDMDTLRQQKKGEQIKPKSLSLA